VETASSTTDATGYWRISELKHGNKRGCFANII